ncbi:MAG: DUF3575 domain-containing protein [Bacteroidales bacterium]
MKNVVFSLLLLIPLALQAQVSFPVTAVSKTSDSVIMQSTLYFDYNVCDKIAPSQDINVCEILKRIKESPETKIRLIGWTDAKGTNEFNRIFSLKRADCIKRYLIKNGIAAERIISHGEGVDTQAILDKKARRVDLVQITELILPYAPMPTQPPAEQPQEQSKKIEITAQEEQPKSTQEQQFQSAQEQQFQSAQKQQVQSIQEQQSAIFAIKTNLLYDAAITPNLEFEIPIGKRWSINAEYQLAWWNKKDNSFCWRINAAGIETRYWLGNRKKHKSLSGWFAGISVNGGTYDFQLKKDNGYQGNFIVPGISGGYTTPVARNLNMEFSLGVGYMMSNYLHYNVISNELVDNGETKHYRNIFPTKAKVSLVWIINHNVKRGGK